MKQFLRRGAALGLALAAVIGLAVTLVLRKRNA